MAEQRHVLQQAEQHEEAERYYYQVYLPLWEDECNDTNRWWDPNA